jgi:hypothetical protein
MFSTPRSALLTYRASRHPRRGSPDYPPGSAAVPPGPAAPRGPRPPPSRITPPRRSSNASCCAKRWPRPRAIIRRPPRPWGCSHLFPTLAQLPRPPLTPLGHTLCPKGYRPQGPRAGRPLALGRPPPAVRAPPLRRAAPRGPPPGGAQPFPTARRPNLAWILRKHWTVPMPRCLPPPVGEAEDLSRNDHQTGRREVYASRDSR